jgi:hypothetical protein
MFRVYHQTIIRRQKVYRWQIGTCYTSELTVSVPADSQLKYTHVQLKESSVGIVG